MTEHVHTTDGGGDGFDDIVAQLVDQPLYEAPPKLRHRVLSEQRLPILAPWLRDWDQFTAAARWQYDHYRHTWTYHLARTPLYAFRALLRVPIGLWRLTRAALVWSADHEGAQVLAQVVEAKEPERYAKLAELHRERTWRRAMTIAAAPVAAVTVALFAAASGNVRLQTLLALAVIGILSKAGEERDRPIVSRAVVATKAERLTADAVERALWQLRNIKDGDTIGFPSPITRDGAGWRADIDLPPGITAAEVIEQRDKLAAALRRAQGAVWPEPAPDVHPGRLVLWVGDQDMADTKPAKWPLARKGVVSLFDPIPFGQDQRGRPVTITLMYASMVVGAIPRMGKTFAVRLLLLAAALDVRAELHAYDLKGTGDFDALEPVAHRFRAGDDDDDIAYALADARALRDEFRRRAKKIRGLPKNVCPENKVTDQLASRSGFGLHPIVLAVDECQLWYQHPQHGDEFEAIVSDLAKRGPAVGILVINATQEPKATTLPTSISRNAALRFCLKVMDQVANDAVLGTSAYKQGLRATLFKRSDLGIGLLVGEGDEPRVVRTYYVDNPTADAIVERARAARVEAGTLSGHAAGDDQEVDADPGRLLRDVLAVVPADEDKVWSETICQRLADQWPDRYGHFAHDDDEGDARAALAVQLKRFGVETRQTWLAGANRMGVRREQLVEALGRRSAALDLDPDPL